MKNPNRDDRQNNKSVLFKNGEVILKKKKEGRKEKTEEWLHATEN